MKKLTFIFLLFLSLGTSLVFGQAGGRLTGVVLDEAKQPVIGANVILQPAGTGTVTDTDGKFRFNNLTAGSYSVEVSYVGYQKMVLEVDLSEGKTDNLTVSLAEEAVVLEGLTVTAQKRSEIIKEVPIAISNVSGSFLQSTVTESLFGLSEFVPGVQVQEQTVIFPSFVIRGLTSDNSNFNVDNRVSVFQDGVSISKQISSYVEFFDIDRVEVLKGPQGTLFGRSAQIGAFHLITNRAKNETSGSLNLGTGNFNQFKANGHVNVPLAANRVFFRLAGIFNKRDGYVDNISGGTLMGKNTLAGRASLKIIPGDNSAIDLIFNYQRDEMPGVAFKSGTFAPAGGDLDYFTFVDHERGDDLIDGRDVYGATLQFRQYFGNRLSLTAITGYRTLDATSLFDSDGTKAHALLFDFESTYNQISQELRLNYDGDRFSGFIGANYFREDGEQAYTLSHDERSLFAMFSPVFAQFIPNFPIIPMVVNGQPNLAVSANPLTGQPFKTLHEETVNNGAVNTAFDLFADGTFKVTDRFKVTAGGRLIFEDLETMYRVDPRSDSPGSVGFLLGNAPNNVFAPTNGKLVESRTFSDWVGRFILHYDFSDQVSAFASWSKGRRPNVVQVDADTVEVLKAELVYSYELGLKTLMLNNRLQVNLNGFLYDYRNFQTESLEFTAGGNIYTLKDAGKASGLGFEADVKYAIGENATVFANYALLDASFDDEDSDGKEQELAGNTFRLTPKHSGAAGINYRFGLGKTGNLDIQLSGSFKSQHYFEDENIKGLEEDGYVLLNAAAVYTMRNGKYGVRLNANNLTDERYLIDAGNTGLLFGIPTFVPGIPRFFGVQVFANF